MVSCKPEIEKPEIVTKSVREVTETSAKVIGQVTADGGAEVTERGVCWNTEGGPQIIDFRVKDAEGGLGSFTSNLKDLTPQTTYYVRAYATNEAGTSYGEEKSFTTLEKLLPVVTTTEITKIGAYSAVSGGDVTFDGNLEVLERGVCWSTSKNPTIEDNKTSDGGGTGSFASNLTNLEENTTYYVRAYATNGKGTSYGEELTFTTKKVWPDPDGEISGYGYVDLGLPSGLKWATCNIGSTTPEGYGNYYAWGETTTKDTYTAENSLTYGLSDSELQVQGIIDGNQHLTPSYDAATANWGGSWRMPTREEMQELVGNCTWTWTTMNDVNGCRVEGPNGNSIFLPAAGGRYDGSLLSVGSGGDYWSSTPNESYSDFACYLGFGSRNHGVYDSYRSGGRSVRPVSE